MRKCSQCGLSKHLLEFSKDSRKRSGRRRYCKTCQSRYKFNSSERQEKIPSTVELLDRLMMHDGFSLPPDKLYERLNGLEDALAEIAITRRYSLDLRSTAARLFAARAYLMGEEGRISKRHRDVARDLLNHNMTVIQMGAVMGMKDARELGVKDICMEGPCVGETS